MSIAVSCVSAVLKSVAGDKFGNGLVKELIGISIDGISQKGINEITNFIEVEKSKIEYILSRENMQSMGIPEDNIDYVVAEVKDLFSWINITDEVFRECKYDGMKLKDFMWNEYVSHKEVYIENESDIKTGLFGVAETLIGLVRKSEEFSEKMLIQISNSVDDGNVELQKISEYIEDNFDKLDVTNQAILEMLKMIIEQNQTGVEKRNEEPKVKSRTQEYADKWNENMFLNDFDEWDENAGVNIKLSDVYLDKHLPHFIWGENEKESDNLKELLSRYIENKHENNMLLIFGQPGIGKSTLITWITANFVDRIDDILVYKFTSDLINVDWKANEIDEEILNAINISYSDLKGKTLILDGFDEIDVGNDKKEVIDKIYWELIKGKTSQCFSLIITCRENYIREFRRVKCRYIILQPWDEYQIASFYSNYQMKTKKSISELTMENVLSNKETLGIPLILYMTLALNISVIKERSIVAIYGRIFSLNDGIYDRCIYGEPHRVSVIKKQIYEVSQKIAVWMLENNHTGASIPRKEYNKICTDVIKIDMQKGKEIEQDILIGNYFKTIKYYEGIETEEIYFVHRSIYEYFVADTIIESMKENIDEADKLANIFGKLLKGNKLSSKILEFLKYKILDSELRDKFYLVYKAFELMIQDGMTCYTDECYKNAINSELNVFSNMLEIIHLWENTKAIFSKLICDYIRWGNDICNLNLVNIEIQGACLEKANLYGINLVNTKLMGANFEKAFLAEANLMKAKLSPTDFRKAILRKANLTGAILIGSYMNDVDLREAILTSTNLESTELSGADLRKAKLNRTILKNSYLCGADLRGADIKETDFSETDLEASVWMEQDVQKMLLQLSEARFTYIIVEKQEERRRMYKKELISRLSMYKNSFFGKK